MKDDAQPLSRAIARLNRRLRRERDSVLSASQLSVLFAIRMTDPATPSSIAAYERVQPPTITRMLNCLADDGLITRASHPDDGRQVVVQISPLGQKLLSAERERRDAWLSDRLADLSDDERKTLREAAPILLKLANA